MFEILAAVIGVILGAAISWWLSRTSPLLIVCEDSFRTRLTIGGEPWEWTFRWHTSGKEQSLVSFGIGLPETKMLFKETPINTLSVLRLKFRNAGHIVIPKPKIYIHLSETAKILGCDIHTEPEQISSQNLDIKSENKTEKDTISPEQTEFQHNTAIVTLDNLYPFNMSQEVTIVDLFCNGEIGETKVFGRGVLQDGAIWMVKFEPWLNARKRITKNVQLFNQINILGLLIAIVGYFIVKPPFNLIVINEFFWKEWSSGYWFTAVVVWLLSYIIYMFYMAMKGWAINLKLPFINRRLFIALEKNVTEK